MGYTWDLQLKIFKCTIRVVIVIAIGLAIFIQNPLPMIYGLIFATCISMLNFRALALTLEKAVCMTPSKAQTYVASRYFIRFITNGIVIFISLKADYLNIIGVIIGLVLIKAVIFGQNLFNNRTFFRKIFMRKEGK